MASRQGAAHVVTTTRRYKGKVYRTHLLRRSYRDGKSVQNETLANLSHLPEHVIDLIRRSLRGESFVAAGQAFEVVASLPHGDCQAVLLAMKQLGLASLLSSRPCKERDIIAAVIASRILRASPKLSTTRFWKTRTLADTLNVLCVNEDGVYAAMDWLLKRQPVIEKKLAQRHLKQGAVVLYDLSSSYFEGTRCSLAKLGYSRDGKRGKLQVNYGLLCNASGCPVSISVFEGNTSDAKTLLPQLHKLKDKFGIQTLIMVGDRGMISQASIEVIQREHAGVEWVTALKSSQLRPLVEGGCVQLGLFDERNLFELSHPDYPGERLIACRNPDLAKKRRLVRSALLAATEKELTRIASMVERGRLQGQDKIGVRVGRVIDRYKVAKHIVWRIEENKLSFARDENAIASEAALDGMYIIRTSVLAHQMSRDDVVRTYKSLTKVERAFRTLKTVELRVRPIHHRTAERVRSHIFLCMLAYWVEWHMRQVWRPLLFDDQKPDDTRDPVAPAKRSASALHKAQTKRLPDGSEVHSFATLLASLSTIVRNTCLPRGAKTTPPFFMTTEPTEAQRLALELIGKIAA